MTPRVIPLHDDRTQGLAPPEPGLGAQPPADALGRPLRDLRISVTDRCNFRCGYCMPKQVFDKHHQFLPHADLLGFEEITRLARAFASLGVEKLRLTGGEPLLRRDIEALVGQLAALRLPDGSAPDLTLTTNGSLLARKAQALREAGLQRVTVSLDALDDAVFRRMNDADFPVAEALAGIEAAQAAGLGPIKVNMVVQRGVNEDEILPMARHFRGTGIALRFIEYMDVGATNGWRMNDVVPAGEILRRLQAEAPLHPLLPGAPGETAQRWAWADGSGEIGLIASVTQAFCGDCNRARLSNDGKVYLCLFATEGHDLRTPLRAGASDAQLQAALGTLWRGRGDQYSALRAADGAAPDASAKAGDAGTAAAAASRIEMSYIGG